MPVTLLVAQQLTGLLVPGCVQAASYTPPNPGPYPQDQPRRNDVRFTPVQVEAIRAGVQPGGFRRAQGGAAGCLCCAAGCVRGHGVGCTPSHGEACGRLRACTTVQCPAACSLPRPAPPADVPPVRAWPLPAGLTMVVGPPGTGKTDTAVQILSTLYHNCPGQRTLLITHSNQALNDLFTKLQARDVPNRWAAGTHRGRGARTAALLGRCLSLVHSRHPACPWCTQGTLPSPPLSTAACPRTHTLTHPGWPARVQVPAAPGHG